MFIVIIDSFFHLTLPYKNHVKEISVVETIIKDWFFMNLSDIVLIFILIFTSSFFSMAEISLAAARKIRLQQLWEQGNEHAKKVIDMQNEPGNFFTVVQIGLNAVAIMGGIVGESAFTPYISSLLENIVSSSVWIEKLSFILSFFIVTSLFILFADLMPKRIAMAMPEKVAIKLVRFMQFWIVVLKPFLFLFNGLANTIFKLLRMDSERNDSVTSEDIYAVMSAGAKSGVLAECEQKIMESVFEKQSAPVTSAMTPRESITFLSLGDDESLLKKKIAQNPHNKFLVCDAQIDAIVGYIDSKTLLIKMINGEQLNVIDQQMIQPCPMIPDTLCLAEALEYFKTHRTDFAVILNEYSFVVGMVTFDDLQNELTGNWMLAEEEEQIVARDSSSWLIDGTTPISDVMKALNIKQFPNATKYETIAGFIMYTLRKVPRRTDVVNYAGFSFEVVDTDHHKIEQLLVTLIDNKKE